MVGLCIITPTYAGIAQLVEHLIRNEGVASSSLVSGTTKKLLAHTKCVGLKFFSAAAERSEDGQNYFPFPLYFSRNISIIL